MRLITPFTTAVYPLINAVKQRRTAPRERPLEPRCFTRGYGGTLAKAEKDRRLRPTKRLSNGTNKVSKETGKLNCLLPHLLLRLSASHLHANRSFMG
jgi:hypothetical protein